MFNVSFRNLTVISGTLKLTIIKFFFQVFPEICSEVPEKRYKTKGGAAGVAAKANNMRDIVALVTFLSFNLAALL